MPVKRRMSAIVLSAMIMTMLLLSACANEETIPVSDKNYNGYEAERVILLDESVVTESVTTGGS